MKCNNECFKIYIFFCKIICIFIVFLLEDTLMIVVTIVVETFCKDGAQPALFPFS